MADFEDLYSEDPQAARNAAQVLADAMRRRRAAGTVASIIGGPFAQAGRAFLGDAAATQEDLTRAPVWRGGQLLQRQRMAQDQLQHRAQLSAQATAQAESARHNAATEALARSAQEQDAWAAVPDQLGGVVMFNRKTGESRPLGPQVAGQPTGPKLPNFKTADQANAFGFAGRIKEGRRQMAEAGFPVGIPGRIDAAAMGASQGLASKLLPQEAASEPGSRYYNAARNVVAALLRKESGAAIGPTEWEFATSNYIPMPWDSPKARENKLKLLDIMENAMVASAGPAGAAALQEPQGPALTPNAASPNATPPKSVGPRVKGNDGKWYVREAQGWSLDPNQGD